MSQLRTARDFLGTEAAAGLLLIVMVPLALLWANLAPNSYSSTWTLPIAVGPGDHRLTLDLRHWVNDGLMSIFFLVVALEIRHELVAGELRDRRKALTPVLAAIGGMAVPAVSYLVINASSGDVSGWGIPMATDIAIVLGLIGLLGERVPRPLKLFLLTLAIVDDIGAIAVIAIFYSDHAVDIAYLLGALAVAAAIHGSNRAGIRNVVLAGALWWLTHRSGVHATLAGVALGFLLPSGNLRDRLHAWSSYFVLPVFALANAGILLSFDLVRSAARAPEAVGIAVGLVIGKPVGIVLATFVALRFGGRLPTGTTLPAVVAASVLAGVGFTVSLFIADLAFGDPAMIAGAKVAILSASLVAGLVGLLVLPPVLKRRSNESE